MQLEAANPLMEPEAHGWQATVALLVNFPGVHCVQLELPPRLYDPALQPEHELVALTLYVPAWQF